MPGSKVHRSVTEPSAMAMERAFPGRPGSLPWEAWSQFWACEEPVAGVGAQIIPSSSPSIVCRGLECTDRSQSLPKRPWSVPFQAGLDLSLGKLGASYGPVRSQWRVLAPRFVHHHRHRSYAGVWSAQIGQRAFRNGHGACLSRQAWISPLGGLEPVLGL